LGDCAGIEIDGGVENGAGGEKKEFS